jgi:hypothetical protein
LTLCIDVVGCVHDKKTFAQGLIYCKHYFNLSSFIFTVQKEAEQWGGYDGEERHS